MLKLKCTAILAQAEGMDAKIRGCTEIVSALLHCNFSVREEDEEPEMRGSVIRFS